MRDHNGYGIIFDITKCFSTTIQCCNVSINRLLIVDTRAVNKGSLSTWNDNCSWCCQRSYNIKAVDTPSKTVINNKPLAQTGMRWLSGSFSIALSEQRAISSGMRRKRRYEGTVTSNNYVVKCLSSKPLSQAGVTTHRLALRIVVASWSHIGDVWLNTLWMHTFR